MGSSWFPWDHKETIALVEGLSKELLELDWTKFETAPARASYAGLSHLLKEYRRNTGLED